jgi:Zn-dependent protease with chaperone function
MSTFQASDFVHPLDKIARQQLEGIPLLERASRQFLKSVHETQWRAWLLANSIRLSPRQVPELYRHLPGICDAFGINEPELYLMRGQANAFTVGHTRTVIVLYDQLLEDLNDDEVEAVIAHECGHIVCEHQLYRQMAQAIAGTTGLLAQFTGPIGGLASLASVPLQSAMMNWYRKSELSADRAAAVYMADPEPLKRALFHMTGAPKWFAASVSYPDFVAQALEYDTLAKQSGLGKILVKRLDGPNTHPNAAIRFRELAAWADTAEYHALLAAGDRPSQKNQPKCAACGHVMDPNWSFCQRCGTRTDDSGPAGRKGDD